MKNPAEKLDYYKDLTPKGIWGIRQNKPRHIARDFSKFGVPAAVTYAILLGRGVFKWFAARRDLIRLKDAWKAIITNTGGHIVTAKKMDNYMRHWYLKGYLKAYEECYAGVRNLCHSERFRAPDNDSSAQQYLDELRERIDDTEN